jgi:hypothetical protein
MKLEISDKEYELILKMICECESKAFAFNRPDISDIYQNLHFELLTGEKNLVEIEAYRQRKRESK